MTGIRDEQRSDTITLILFGILSLIGWLNVYAAEYDPVRMNEGLFSLDNSAGKQLLWMGSSFVIGILIYVLDFKFFEKLALPVYAVFIFLLIAVLFFGTEISGSRSWFDIGSFRLQPSEFAKFATVLAVAAYLGGIKGKQLTNRHLSLGGCLVILPMLLTLIQGDTGTAMVYLGMILVFYREGMSAWFLYAGILTILLFVLTLLLSQIWLIIGIVVVGLIFLALNGRSSRGIVTYLIVIVLALGWVISVDFVLNDILKPHQQKRIMSLVNPNADPLGIGWNVTQSKIAIGSGGFMGKGYLQGTQTQFNFVPAQTTDFVFCTVGEEHGWLGAVAVVILFVILLLRLIGMAERQKSVFARCFGYGVVAIIGFHFVINISMTIGLFPVIGIPLPFISYGGSALWSFALMLFTFVKLDAHRMEVLQR